MSSDLDSFIFNPSVLDTPKKRKTRTTPQSVKFARNLQSASLGNSINRKILSASPSPKRKKRKSKKSIKKNLRETGILTVPSASLEGVNNPVKMVRKIQW